MVMSAKTVFESKEWHLVETHQPLRLAEIASLRQMITDAATVRSLRSDSEYRAALAEIDALWDSKKGTPEGDRFDLLAILVDAYEREHTPISQYTDGGKL
jgi:hypothetical protein